MPSSTIPQPATPSTTASITQLWLILYTSIFFTDYKSWEDRDWFWFIFPSSSLRAVPARQWLISIVVKSQSALIRTDLTLLIVWPRANSLTSLCLGFFIYKMKIKTEITHQKVVINIKWVKYPKCLVRRVPSM